MLFLNDTTEEVYTERKIISCFVAREPVSRYRADRTPLRTRVGYVTSVASRRRTDVPYIVVEVEAGEQAENIIIRRPGWGNDDYRALSFARINLTATVRCPAARAR